MTAPADSLAATLKEQTADLHTSAERHPVQRALATGRIGRDAYAAYLAQMLHIHRSLDPALRAAAASGPLASLVREHHFREEQLRADLAALGGDGHDVTASAAEFAAWIGAASGCAATLAGVLYVLEGSTNGGQYIARALRRALDLGAGGTAYFDPHGDAQRERWSRFKADLDSLTLSADQRGIAIGAARRTFAAVVRVCNDLAAPGVPALAG